MGVEHVRFRLRGSTDERTAQVLTQVKDLLAGVPERDIERMGPDLLAGVLPRIYPKMLEEVRAHQDAGRATFIVSAAGNGLVEMLARVLGMDGGIGTRYEVAKDGLLTGRIVEPFVYGEGKVAAMRRLPMSTTSTCRSPGRTPTPRRTCPCCGPWAIRWPSIPTPSREARRRRGLAGHAVREAGQAAGDRRRHGGGGGQWHPAGDAPQALGAAAPSTKQPPSPLSEGRHRTRRTRPPA